MKRRTNWNNASLENNGTYVKIPFCSHLLYIIRILFFASFDLPLNCIKIHDLYKQSLHVVFFFSDTTSPYP